MRRGARSAWTRVGALVAALGCAGCIATKAWLRDAERERDHVLLRHVSATTRDAGRIVQLRVEDAEGEVTWYRAYANQTPAQLDEDEVLPGSMVPVVASPPPGGAGTFVVQWQHPGLPPMLEVHFADGTQTVLELPVRYEVGVSHLMYAFTPLVALGEAVLYPVLGPAYVLAVWARTPVR